MAQTELDNLKKELIELLSLAHKVANELSSIHKQGIGISQNHPGTSETVQETVNRPGVAGSSGAGNPITGISNTPGYVALLTAFTTSMRVHQSNATGTIVKDHINNEFRQANESINKVNQMFNERRNVYGQWSSEETFRPYVSLVSQADRSPEWIRAQKRLHGEWITNLPDVGDKYNSDAFLEYHKYFANSLGGQYYFARNSAKYGLQYVRSAQLRDKLSNIQAGNRWSDLLPTAAEKVAAGKFLGKAGAIATMIAQDSLEIWEIDQRTAQAKHSFVGQRPTLNNTLAAREVMGHSGSWWDKGSAAEEKAAIAMRGAATVVSTIVGGPITGAIAYGLTYAAQLGAAPINRYGIPFTEQYGGTYRTEQEIRKKSIADLVRQYCLGDLRVLGPKGRILTAQERGSKWLRDRNMTEAIFRQTLGEALTEKQEAYRMLELGQFHASPKGDYALKTPADLMRMANDKMQGVAPNWSRPQDIYQMFEAARMGTRLFARAMSQRGSIRSGD